MHRVLVLDWNLSVTKPGIEVKSQLVFWSVVKLREYFKFLPQLQ